MDIAAIFLLKSELLVSPSQVVYILTTRGARHQQSTNGHRADSLRIGGSSTEVLIDCAATALGAYKGEIISNQEHPLTPAFVHSKHQLQSELHRARTANLVEAVEWSTVEIAAT